MLSFYLLCYLFCYPPNPTYGFHLVKNVPTNFCNILLLIICNITALARWHQLQTI